MASIVVMAIAVNARFAQWQHFGVVSIAAPGISVDRNSEGKDSEGKDSEGKDSEGKD